MPEHLDKARRFRERAETLRRIAAALPNLDYRDAVEEAAREYDRMAEMKAAKSMVRLHPTGKR